MKQIAHTKTPFKITHPLPTSLFIEDEIGSVICQFPDYAIDREANAAHIVRCVNSHGLLISAAEKAMVFMENILCNYTLTEHEQAVYDAAKAALAAARRV